MRFIDIEGNFINAANVTHVVNQVNSIRADMEQTFRNQPGGAMIYVIGGTAIPITGRSAKDIAAALSKGL